MLDINLSDMFHNRCQDKTGGKDSKRKKRGKKNKKGNKEESAEEKEAREQKRKIENEAKKAEFHVVVHANTLVLIHSFICVSPALSLSLSLDLI